MKMILMLVVTLTMVGCSNPKTITCPICSSSSVKYPSPKNMNGVMMDQYMCPNQHITFKKQ